MLSTLLFVFIVWLPFATTLRAVVDSSTGSFSQKWKQALFILLALPALAASFLTALVSRHQGLIDKLDKIGVWFKS